MQNVARARWAFLVPLFGMGVNAWASPGLAVDPPVDLGVLPGGDNSSARALNEGPEVVGYSRVDVGGVLESHATVWGPTITDLGTGGYAFSRADGISDTGYIIGTLQTTGQYDHAALWDPSGNLTDLGMGGAVDVNDVGVVVGFGCNTLHAAKWDPSGACTLLGNLGGTYSAALDINEQGLIVGDSYTTTSVDDVHGFLFQNGTLLDLHLLATDLASAERSVAQFINESGTIAGMARFPGLEDEPFLYDVAANVLTRPGWPASDCTYVHVRSLNEVDQMLVVCGSADFANEDAYLWNGQAYAFVGPSLQLYEARLNDLGMVVANDYSGCANGQCGYVWMNGERVDLPPATGGGTTFASDINDSGEVSGGYVTSSGNLHAALWSIQILPPTPQDDIEDVADEVDTLVDNGTLSGGEGNSLDAKLDAATRKLDEGKCKPAQQMLQAFIQQVQAMMASGRLTPAEGQPLIDAANAILATITC